MSLFPTQLIQTQILLRDHDDSNAWTDWLHAANLPHHTRADTLIILDPNVRVQSVINGQGIALMDQMIQDEIDAKRLFPLSEVNLTNYGYFIARPSQTQHPASVDKFVEWIMNEFKSERGSHDIPTETQAQPTEPSFTSPRRNHFEVMR